MYDNYYKNQLNKEILFELKSIIGRLFYNRKPKLKKNENLLNICCGANYLPGFINADFYQITHRKKVDWFLDLRYTLNCNSNIWDGILCEHTIEHLYPLQVLNLLKELNRTMKNNSTIRIIVPDLRQFVDYYNGKKSDHEFKKRYKKRNAIHYLTQRYGHKSVWDYDNLKEVLLKSGFGDIKKCKYNCGYDNRLLKDIKTRKWSSLYVEAKKIVN